MERLSQYHPDDEVTIWVCPNRHFEETIAFVSRSIPPLTTRCGRCGEEFIKRCGNPDCADPTFHPSDEQTRHHRICGALVPWLASSVFVPPGLVPEDEARQLAKELRKSEVLSRQPSATGKKAQPKRGITWGELEELDRASVGLEAPKKNPWSGLSGPAKWLLGILGSAIAGVIVLLVRNWLIGQGLLSP